LVLEERNVDVYPQIREVDPVDAAGIASERLDAHGGLGPGLSPIRHEKYEECRPKAYLSNCRGSQGKILSEVKTNADASPHAQPIPLGVGSGGERCDFDR
jgi:hypothetical protein